MKLCKIGQSCPAVLRSISLCSFHTMQFFTFWYFTLQFSYYFAVLCGFHSTWGTCINDVRRFLTNFFILLCCTFRFSYYFAVLIFKSCRIGQSCAAKRKRILKQCKICKSCLSKRKRILKFCKRSIFQTFWKPDFGARYLFIELDTSNFGYLLIF